MDPTLKRLAPTYTVLLLRNMAWAITLSGPVMPLYVRSLGVDMVQWGILAAALSAGLFLEAIWGAVLDRVDRRLFVLGALIITSLIYPLYTVKSLLPLFIVFQFAFGAIQVVIGLTTRLLIADEARTGSSGFYMSLWFFFATFGFILGPIVGSFIAATYGYEYAFFASTGIVWVATLFWGISYIRNKGEPIVRRLGGVGMLTGLRRLLGVPTLRATYVIALMAILGNSGISSFLPIYATERLGMSTIAVGGMITAGALARLVATPLVGRLSDRVDKRKLLIAVLALSSLFFTLFLFAVDQYQLAAVTVLVSLCFSSGVLSIAIHSGAAPKELSGMAMGLYGTFEDLGLMLGATLFGFAWTIFGPQSVFVISAVAAAIAVASALTIGREKR